MSFRTRATVAAFAVLGLGPVALAQPQAPPRPYYGSYGNLFRQGGGSYFFGGPGYYGYGPAFGGGLGPGWGGFGPNQQLMQQNLQLQQQLNYNNQSLANLQTYLATGVNPNLPITGQGATFNYLGHWYPSARNGGGGGIGGGGTMVVPGGSGGGVPTRPAGTGTAGNGIPVGGGRP
jgi:hypothetical protein